jgi:hypothetical protein
MKGSAHIGDGVYVSHDGFQLWLAVNNHRNNVVALEPIVCVELIKKMTMIIPPAALAEELRKIADKLENPDAF